MAHLKLIPERRLLMTFALRQALNILQMPQLELAQWLEEEIEKNPLLERLPSKYFPLPPAEIAAPISLYEHLMLQVRDHFSSSEEQEVAKKMIEQLDEKGFCTTPLETIAVLLEKPLSQIEKIFSVMQTFDPPGIFARTLQEALLLQLKAHGEEETLLVHLVRDCFEDLLRGRFALIKKKMGVRDFSREIQKLARLSLRPAEAFKQEVIPTAIADLRISQVEGGWKIEVAGDELPQFQIQPEYAILHPEAEEEKKSLRQWLAASKWLLRSLQRRRQLLLKIGAFLACKQAAYLSQTGDLCPLTLQELAASLELHESTASRALAGKYAATPRGLIPLRSLLSLSTNEVKHVLQKLIAQEEKPLTDDQLATKLQALGYRIARRTVAKYRRALKIHSVTSRKFFSLDHRLILKNHGGFKKFF